MACRSLLKDSQIDASKWAWKLLQTPEQPDNMSCGVYNAEGMTERWLTKGRSETSHVLRLYKINIIAVTSPNKIRQEA